MQYIYLKERSYFQLHDRHLQKRRKFNNADALIPNEEIILDDDIIPYEMIIPYERVEMFCFAGGVVTLKSLSSFRGVVYE